MCELMLAQHTASHGFPLHIQDSTSRELRLLHPCSESNPKYLGQSREGYGAKLTDKVAIITQWSLVALRLAPAPWPPEMIPKVFSVCLIQARESHWVSCLLSSNKTFTL